MRVGLTWCACLAVLCGAVTVFAGSGQVVRVAVVDAGGNLLPEASLQAANEDGSRGVAVTRLEDDTFAIKGATAKLVLQVQHPALGSATALLSLPADPEVSVAVYLENGVASAVVVQGRLPEVAPHIGISATAPVISGPFVADITPTRAASGEVAVRDPAARLIGGGSSDRGAGEARQGGDTCASAVTLSGALPIVISGTTSGYADDYEVMDGVGCPYSSTSPDVVYVYYPAADGEFDVEICDSLYDTKLFIYEDTCGGTAVACNDDACGSDGYKSGLSLEMLAGHAYYIVIDGYGGDFGDYTLAVDEYVPPPPDCPEGTTLFGQAMDGSNAANSNAGVYTVYESFWGLEGIICDLHWKGINAFFDGAWGPCADPMPVDSFFDITFYENTGGVPGAVVCSYADVHPSKVDTGDLFAGYPIYRFEIDLPTCCMLLDGWVSIVGDTSDTCW
ncbi:MAG: hypothetical protein KJ749_08480, partial [Planctomycetes bacterium]|nr:hypothetical protein [Planctomycetota bacterium]